jgi:hypothetical protein
MANDYDHLSLNDFPYTDCTASRENSSEWWIVKDVDVIHHDQFHSTIQQ